MTRATRVSALEEKNLTPREAVILWMREAHQFHSLLDYGLWLIEQPDDVYPLVRMPSQVVAGVRSRHKGILDVCLKEEFYRAQRDVLFLFHIHKQLNLRVITDLETVRLRFCLLSESLRSIVAQAYMVDTLRLERLEFPEDLAQPMPKRKKKAHEVALEKDIAAWDEAEKSLGRFVSVLAEAESILARRYFAGELLLFDDSRRQLDATISALCGSREIYQDVLRRRPPQEDEDFIRWIGAKAGGEGCDPLVEQEGSCEPKQPSVKAEALAIAEHVVVVARSEALGMLGETEASIRTVTDWMKEHRER